MKTSLVITVWLPRLEVVSSDSVRMSFLFWSAGGTPLGLVHQRLPWASSISLATKPESIDIRPSSVDRRPLVVPEREMSKDCLGGALLGAGAGSLVEGCGAPQSCIGMVWDLGGDALYRSSSSTSAAGVVTQC